MNENDGFIYSLEFVCNDKYIISGYIDGLLMVTDLKSYDSFKECENQSGDENSVFLSIYLL